MGHRYVVKVWVCTDARAFIYEYETFWEGESVIIALMKLWRSTRLHYGHSVLEWRR